MPTFSMINNLPALTWVKDTKFRYQSLSKRLTHFLGISEDNPIIGQDDYALSWAQWADIYRNEDEQVIKGHSKICFHHATHPCGSNFMIVTRKSPFHDEAGNILGILGHVTLVTQPHQVNAITALQCTDFETHALDKNTNSYEDLTDRQIECLYYLVQGMSAKETAKILDISPRTIEFHLETLKLKLKCKYRAELIQQALLLPAIKYRLVMSPMS